jgi:hypothetical protein
VNRKVNAPLFWFTAIALLLAAAFIAYANSYPPVAIKSNRAFILELIPLIIEALYFRWAYKLGYVRALLLSAAANLVSFMPSWGLILLGISTPEWNYFGLIPLAILYAITSLLETPVYLYGLQYFGTKGRWKDVWIANLISYPIFYGVVVFLGYYTLLSSN